MKFHISRSTISHALRPCTTALILFLWAFTFSANAQAPVPEGGEIQVNTYTAGSPSFPSVSAATNGDFVTVWNDTNSFGTDSSSNSILGQRYASDGSTQGSVFQINTFTTANQTEASVSSASNGDFVGVWHSFGSGGTDLSEYSVQGQRYTSDGSLGPGQRISSQYLHDGPAKISECVLRL